MTAQLAGGNGFTHPVLVAALRAFSEHGYDGASTRLIARYAQMSPAAVYIHFPTKGDLLGALVMSGLEPMTQAMREALDGVGDSPADRLRSLVEAFVRWHASNAPLARVVQYESRHLRGKWQDEYRRARRDTQGLFIDEIRRGQECGAFRVEDERVSAIAILSMGIDVARWYPDRPVEKPEALSAHYAELAMRIVAA